MAGADRDIDGMSRDELVALVRGGGLADAPSARIEKVTVDGLTVEIDLDKAVSWKGARLMAKLSSDIPDGEKFPYMIEFYEFVMGDSLDAVLEHFGGPEKARVDDVCGFISRVLEESSAKK